MAKRKGGDKQAEAYVHGKEEATRKNIPEAGMVDYVQKDSPRPSGGEGSGGEGSRSASPSESPITNRQSRKTGYCWDPRESPQLVWAGKAGLKKVEVEEETSLEVPLVNLHIHERVSTEAILRSARRQDAQRSLFADPELDFQREIQFYQHDVDWSNRMILGDSLLVMNSLLEREGMRGSVQCIYMDPPYGIKYASNFQPRIDQRDVKDGKDEDLTREVMQVQAFRDTWELGVHSYLTYLRDRLLLARELLKDEGSIFVQIGDENVHRVRCLMDEVFGDENFASLIAFAKTTGFSGSVLSGVTDYAVWYCKSLEEFVAKRKFRQLMSTKIEGEEGASKYRPVETIEALKQSVFDQTRLVTSDQLTSQGASASSEQRFEFQGRKWTPRSGLHWKTTVEGLRRLGEAGRVIVEGDSIRYVRFMDDFPVFPLHNAWMDIGGIQSRTDGKVYAVQTSAEVVSRCILMTTDPGDLVLDPTCGSGTTAYVAEQWGRRWITMDTSRVALAIARHRLMTAAFDYYKLRHPTSGVSGGFVYKTVPHITLRSIAQNTEIDRIAEEYCEAIEAALKNVNRFRPDLDKEGPWKEWEVPRDLSELSDPDRPRIEHDTIKGADSSQTIDFSKPTKEAEEAHKRFWELKREMQVAIDASIAKNAPTEELVDQPEKESGIVRVSGPFTMEAVPNVGAEYSVTVEEKVFGDALQMQVFEPQTELTAVEARNVSAYLSDMIEKLRKTGVVAKSGKKLSFTSLRPVDHAVLHAEGEMVNGATDQHGQALMKRVGIVFGPQNGSISESHVKEALASGRRYDVLLLCGYDFTPTAQEMAQAASQPDWQVLLAYVAPDTVMTDLLKDTKASQLFTMIGEPDVVVYRHGDPDLPRLLEDAAQRSPRPSGGEGAGGEGDVARRAAELKEGELFIELRGVDLYDPLSGEVKSDAGENVHAIFIDQDYDGKSFCICQALFPNKKDSWTKIARNLKGTIDEEAFSAFRTLVSLPFKPGTSFDKERGEGRVQIKVIDQRGNAVVKTVRV